MKGDFMEYIVFLSPTQEEAQAYLAPHIESSDGAMTWQDVKRLLTVRFGELNCKRFTEAEAKEQGLFEKAFVKNGDLIVFNPGQTDTTGSL